jgi:hypothetical protein
VREIEFVWERKEEVRRVRKDRKITKDAVQGTNDINVSDVIKML